MNKKDFFEKNNLILFLSKKCFKFRDGPKFPVKLETKYNFFYFISLFQFYCAKLWENRTKKQIFSSLVGFGASQNQNFLKSQRFLLK